MSELREKIRRPILKLINDMEAATNRGPFEGDADEWAVDVVNEILALIQKEQVWRDIAQQAERLIWNYAIANIPTEPEREAARELCEQLRGPTPPQEQGS